MRHAASRGRFRDAGRNCRQAGGRRARAAAAPAGPELTPAQAKAQAQKLALEAVDQLQNGDEAAARQTLEKALALDPTNDLARKLQDQIKADAQKELGPVFFRYTVQRDDSLSKLAQQYMGDRFRFYILAKYNDIANPSRLAAGQVIKIPGRAPATPPRRRARAARRRPAEPLPRRRRTRGQAARRRGRPAAAGQGPAKRRATSKARTRPTARRRRRPRQPRGRPPRDATRTRCSRTLDREGTQAFQRQNLDLAITKWDRVLETRSRTTRRPSSSASAPRPARRR